MTNEELRAMVVEMVQHMRTLGGANPTITSRLLAGVLTLDDGTDQWRIYQIEQAAQLEDIVELPKQGQRICFIGKGPSIDPGWMVAMFEFETDSSLENSMRIDLPLVGTTEYLALRVFDYIVNGNCLRDPKPPKFNQ